VVTERSTDKSLDRGIASRYTIRYGFHYTVEETVSGRGHGDVSSMAELKIRFCWITARDDRTEHAVTDEAQESNTVGVLNALCGNRFIIASMEVGPERRCLYCTALLRSRRTCPARPRLRGRHAA
jgi:hypothetical protein